MQRGAAEDRAGKEMGTPRWIQCTQMPQLRWKQEEILAAQHFDEKLQRVRDEFVQRVSEEMINQLLDKLLTDGVLQNEEKDSVCEKNLTRANKARSLIDAVIRKGHEASMKMIAHLESKDPMLFQQLGLSSAQPSQSAKRKKKICPSEEKAACKLPRQQDKPDGVKSGKTQSQDLSEMQLLQVALQLGQEWKQVAIYLGLETKDLEDIEAAENCVKMRKLKMLVKWKRRRKPGQATAYHLQKSLEGMEDLPHEVHEILTDMIDNQAAK
ncbi:uncharacterized protein LOC124884287 isoform X2 [Girardinichthys multiradiatus]|uniref:uncharacterized protein LOC124884287 isoform X2 n=1 Tax=Girardinichthys multiradiatus TaxID=208333 RepID=UPI001FAC7892|nr:uncharacterized protein LOC124884287 isoform X2 [Girardinichthys multiradiatus]